MSVPIILVVGNVNAGRPDLINELTAQAAENGALIVQGSNTGAPLSPIVDRGTGDWNASGAAGSGEALVSTAAELDAILDPASDAHIEGAYLAGVVWVHGERDYSHPTAVANYGDDLVELRDHMVAVYGPHEWIVVPLSADPLGNNSGSERAEGHWIAIRNAQLALETTEGFTVVDPDAVAAAAGIPTTEMFIVGNLHFSEQFQPVLADAIADAFPDLAGDANVVVGTEGMDILTIAGGDFSYVIGGGGADIADFGSLSHGINVRQGDGTSTDIWARRGDRDFGAELQDVERIHGTDYDDYFAASAEIHVFDAGAGNDRVIGFEFGDRAVLGEGNDLAFGGDGDDFFRGNEGNDRIRGGNGDDVLWGDEGNDLLQGGAGDDILVGGAGDDRIDPNHGADTIIFRGGDSGRDRVNGFDAREDVLDFRGLGLDADDFDFNVSGRNLVITVNGHGVEAEVTLINRGNIDPGDLSGAEDWILI